MKALVLEDYNRFVYTDAPTPEPAPNEVLIAVRACGICGSDVHGMDGSTGRRRPPIIMGHEAAGVIAKVGSAVTGWAEGDRVTFDSTIYCGSCEYCRSGQINLCNNRRVLGVSCEDYRQNGAFAEFVAVPQHILYRLPGSLSFEYAAMVEPFSIAVHAVGLVKPPLSASIVVVGAGMIGLALIQALRQNGAGKLVAVDVDAGRLELAKKCGATHSVSSASSHVVEQLKEITGHDGADYAFEAVGIPPTVDTVLRCLRKGGTAVLVGNVTPKVELPLQVVVTRELTVQGSCASRGEYPACIDMLARGALDPAPLISAQAPLAEGAEWFARLHRKEPGLLKVVLTP